MYPEGRDASAGQDLRNCLECGDRQGADSNPQPSSPTSGALSKSFKSSNAVSSSVSNSPGLVGQMRGSSETVHCAGHTGWAHSRCTPTHKPAVESWSDEHVEAGVEGIPKGHQERQMHLEPEGG